MATSAIAVGAGAFLAACGGSSDESAPSANRDRSGLVTPAVDTSKQAKRGGILKLSERQDVANFDPYFSLVLSYASTAYSRLTQVKAGYLDESDGTIVGDIVESMEYSPDKLTLSMKLRDTKFAPLPPVNGRPVDVQDILYSWQRFSSVGAERGQLVNAVSPDAPVLSLTAPDSKTIVMKLKEPVSTLLSTLAATTSGNFYIVPKEADGQVDLRRDQLGSGPFYRSDYVPSSRFVYKRNPGYYDKEHPYVDEVEIPIITEYGAGLAQFRSGQVYTYLVRPEEVVGLKREIPQLAMYEADFATPNIVAFFGWRPTSPEKTPFRDVRVRQAYSMAWDRDLFIDVVYDVQNYQAQGLPIETRWNSSVICTAFRGWRIDPRDKEFGPNGKFFQHDVAESKKLLAAAGFPNGVSVTSNRITTPNYGADWPKQVEVLEGMASEAGFRFTLNPVNFNTNWVPEFREAKGNFEGLSYRGVPAEPDVSSRLYAEYSKNGGRFTGFDPEGKGTYAGDPTCEDMLLKMRGEFDDTKRKELASELQRYLGKMQYYIRSPGGASGLSLAWPALQNFQVYRGDGRPNFTYWLDDTKAPIKPS